MYASSEGSVESAHMRRLACAFYARQCYKYKHLMYWHLYILCRENKFHKPWRLSSSWLRDPVYCPYSVLINQSFLCCLQYHFVTLMEIHDAACRHWTIHHKLLLITKRTPIPLSPYLILPTRARQKWNNSIRATCNCPATRHSRRYWKESERNYINHCSLLAETSAVSFCLFGFIPYVPSTIFQLNRDSWTSTKLG